MAGRVHQSRMSRLAASRRKWGCDLGTESNSALCLSTRWWPSAGGAYSADRHNRAWNTDFDCGPPWWTAEQFQTTRRNSPVLSLFLGSDREWVAWMPEGYYDTSIAGDRRLLGWHVNKGLAAPPEFYPMSRYETQLRQPRLIDTLLRTADAVGAVSEQAPPVVAAPPTIRMIAPVPAAPGAEIAVQQPSLDLRIEIVGSPGRLVRSLVVRNGSARYPLRSFDPPLSSVEMRQEIRLQPQQNAISVVATDNQGVEQIQALPIRLNISKPAISTGPRLVIRSIGVEKFKGRDIPAIPFAALDARKLADFLVAPADTKHFREDRIDSKVLDGSGATSGEILNVFERLSAEIKERKLRAGDTVFLVIESHVLNLGPPGSLVLGALAEGNRITSETSVPAQAISDRLEEVASEGCLVLLLLDGIHEHMPGPSRSPLITEWVRGSEQRRGDRAACLQAEPQRTADSKRRICASSPGFRDGRRTRRQVREPGRSNVADSGRLSGRRCEPGEGADRTQAVRGFLSPRVSQLDRHPDLRTQSAPSENVAKR